MTVVHDSVYRPPPDAAAHVVRGPRHPDFLRAEYLQHRVEQTAHQSPERTAIAFGDEQLTYQMLDRQANRLAHHLRADGIGPGRCVGILLNRSPHLYSSLLAVLKCGAAYVPLHPQFPSDRLRYIVSDAAISTVITTTDLAAQHDLHVPYVVLDQEAETVAHLPDAPLRADASIDPERLCYIIYTSGSTGRPKGVAITHRSVCHWLRATQPLYGITPEDRVYQGFTVAFDAAVEEIWLTLAQGATLVPATPEMEQAGPDLPRLLTTAAITVLSCAPTLLSFLEGELPTVRLLILGGEDCPQSLVERWSAPGRLMLNTYGPTEATVTATASICVPAAAVTIGHPLPNYDIYLLDDNLQPVAPHQPGEVCIGGPGLARGYVGRDDLTHERFIPHPCKHHDDEPDRLYRTGDLACLTDDGAIRFLGRSDAQVKIRGFRIELTEIESQLLAAPGVRAAAVARQELTPGIPSLVGYVVSREGETCSLRLINQHLRHHLPAYMVPAIVMPVHDLPTLPSGKIDRARLPKPTLHRRPEETHVAPRTEDEEAIAVVWAEAFARESISITDDFFHDLGGHSLFAARCISRLREVPRFADVSLANLYAHPTVESLAAAFAQRATADDHPPIAMTKTAATRRRVRRATPIQAIGVCLLQFFLFLPVWTLWLAFHHHTPSLSAMVVIAVGVLLADQPLMLGLSIIAKWVLIGRFKAGRYPLWGTYYLRWWFVRRLQTLTPLYLITGTPLMRWYCRLMGAHIGRDCFIGTPSVFTYDLLTINDRTSIGYDAHLLGYTVENGELIIGPVTIGTQCCIGVHAVLSPHSAMGDGAELAEQSLLRPGEMTPANQCWAGSPARPAAAPAHVAWAARAPSPSRRDRTGFLVAFLIGSAILSVLPVLAAVPGLLIVSVVARSVGVWSILTSPLIALTFIITLCGLTVACKCLLPCPAERGAFSLHSWRYVRKWFMDTALQQNLIHLNPLFATLYAPPYLRLLGARIGRRAEVSTVRHISPDLLDIGEECFVADRVYMGVPRIAGNRVQVDRTSTGPRTFIGNGAVIPAGSEIPGACLIGVASTTPVGIEFGSSWLGVPPIQLPRREVQQAFGEEQTFTPSRSRIAQRYAVEFFRVLLPATFTAAATASLYMGLSMLSRVVAVPAVMALVPLLTLCVQTVATLAIAGLKRLLIGRYRPTQKPLWNSFVWRSELITGLYESVTVPNLLVPLLGTPFCAWILRRFGMRIGKRAFFDTTLFSEFDLIAIGDDVALNYNCTMQTHLFEDRVMKMSSLQIGDGCAVGAAAVVLHDSKMGPGSCLGALSLLMKGESLLPHTSWVGIPAQRDALYDAPTEAAPMAPHTPRHWQLAGERTRERVSSGRCCTVELVQRPLLRGDASDLTPDLLPSGHFLSKSGSPRGGVVWARSAQRSGRTVPESAGPARVTCSGASSAPAGGLAGASSLPDC
jgi:non-ribosomal peptide synthetase-like protein